VKAELVIVKFCCDNLRFAVKEKAVTAVAQGSSIHFVLNMSMMSACPYCMEKLGDVPLTYRVPTEEEREKEVLLG
jgi:hypothetical protein